MTNTVAVTAASGQLGRLVVEALLRRGVTPVAIVRDPDKVADLAARGVDVRRADYADAEALDRALAGVHRVLLISGTDFETRVAQHATVIRAAERAGVESLAYTSIPAADRNPMVLARDHRATEEVLAGSTVPHTLLRNGWYWENYLGGLTAAIESGVLYGAAGTGRIAGAARADYAEAAAEVLTGDGHAGAVYELGGDASLDLDALAEAIATASGKPVRYQNVPEADYARALEANGIPAAFAGVLADTDTGIAAGLLDVGSGDLGKLLGRPTTPAVEVFRAALG